MRGAKPAVRIAVTDDSPAKEDVKLPECPEKMAKLGLKEDWDTAVLSLHTRRLLADDIMPILRLYVLTIWDINDALDKISKHGRTQLDKKSGLQVKNPAVSDLKVAREEFLRYAVELGLTPSAKARKGMSGVGPKSYTKPEGEDAEDDGAPAGLAV